MTFLARIRTVKPEFWSSAQVVECSRDARLLFIGLWNFCDDAGRHRYAPKSIKAEVFPADDDLSVKDVAALLSELQDERLIVRYESGDESYLRVTGWHHQRIDKPSVKFPAPPEDSVTVPIPFDETSDNARPCKGREGSVKEGSRMERNGEEGTGKEGSTPAGTGGDIPPELRTWLTWWNGLHDEGLVSAGVAVEPPSQAILKGWSRVGKSIELRQLLVDRDGIEAKIRESEFVREGWFRLEKLFGGTNRDGELIVRKLIEGSYSQRRSNGKQPVGPGQRHTPGLGLDPP